MLLVVLKVKKKEKKIYPYAAPRPPPAAARPPSGAQDVHELRHDVVAVDVAAAGAHPGGVPGVDAGCPGLGEDHVLCEIGGAGLDAAARASRDEGNRPRPWREAAAPPPRPPPCRAVRGDVVLHVPKLMGAVSKVALVAEVAPRL